MYYSLLTVLSFQGIVVIFVYILVAILAIFLAFMIVIYLIARSQVKSRYEWLLLLSRTEWKFGTDLTTEMVKRKSLKDGSFLIGIVYGDLSRLENEGLVESREELQSVGLVRIEYRLTSSGVRKWSDMTTPKTSTSLVHA